MSVRSYVIDEQGLTNSFAVEPKMYLQNPRTDLGTAEMLNGRLAMIGFVSLMLLEILTGHGVTGFIASLS